MQKVSIQLLENWYQQHFQKKISGRYITLKMILPLIKELDGIFSKDIIGYSFKKKPIYKITLGKGSKQILLWSQMHGNESTGTKALFDVFQFFSNPMLNANIVNQILTNCTLVFIPMLNPDGAKNFSRLNAQKIDLNRDAVDLKAPESKLLNKILKEVNPKFCFNLHDQRTIFNVKGTNNPASISFLAPSEDFEKTITKNRKETMSVICEMNDLLQKIIPNQVGRFTDEFYPTATGDNFQKLGHNTILIEAGHFKNDYEREQVRKLNFFALIQGLHSIATVSYSTNYKPYFQIPNNEKQCFDIIYRNVNYPVGSINDVAYQYDYKIEGSKLFKFNKLEKFGALDTYFGHEEIDLDGKELP